MTLPEAVRLLRLLEGKAQALDRLLELAADAPCDGHEAMILGADLRLKMAEQISYLRVAIDRKRAAQRHLLGGISVADLKREAARLRAELGMPEE